MARRREAGVSRLLTIVVCGLFLAGCRKGGGSTADAGSPRNRSMDLRTGLTLIFPEWRGAQVVAGHARVSRRVQPVPKEWKRDSEVALTANQFKVSSEGDRLVASREPFSSSAEVMGEGLVQVVSIPLTADDVARIFQSPAPLSSEQLAMWLPRFPGSQYTEEFTLSLHYRTVPNRADFLTRQLVELSTAGLWKVKSLPKDWGENKPDGGYGSVPEVFELTMIEQDSGATIELKKERDDVSVTYRLPTR
jgi:hypothetical protein